MSDAFDLVVECCRRCFTGDGSACIDKLLPAADWPLVLRLAHRHRVEALVWDALDSGGALMPQDIAAAFKADATATADHNLRSAAECSRIAGAFEARGISLLFLK